MKDLNLISFLHILFENYAPNATSRYTYEKLMTIHKLN